MKFLKAKMSTLLQCACVVFVGGVRVTQSLRTGGVIAVSLEGRGADERCYFRDEEVVVSPDGFAEVNSMHLGNFDEQKVVQFLMTRPMNSSDLV